MINVDYTNKKSKYSYVIETGGEDVEKWKNDRFNPKNWKQVPNDQYDPDIKPDKKPEYCEGHVSFECLRNGTVCPHFAFGKPEKKIKEKFSKMVRKHYGIDKKKETDKK
jgi:hypothetical protein